MNLSSLAKLILWVHLAQAILASAVPSLDTRANGEEADFSHSLHDFAVRLSAKQPVAHTGDKRATAERIAHLIAQLGSDQYAERSQAQESLAKIGLPARPALLAALSDKDVERAQRAKEILAGLALSRNNWPTEWDAMTFSFGVRSADPAKCMEFTIDAQRRVVFTAWSAASKTVTTTETVLSPKDLQPLWIAFGRLQPWTLNKVKQWPAGDGSGMIGLDITVENQFANIAQPWPPTSTVKTAENEMVIAGLMGVHDAALQLMSVVQRDAAIQSQSQQADNLNKPLKKSPTTAAPIAQAGATPRQTGELSGDERREANNARDTADRAWAEYAKTYRPHDWKDNVQPPAADEDFAKVEKLYKEVIERYSLTEIGVYCRERLAGAYQYRGQREKTEALKQEAEEARAAVAQLMLEHGDKPPVSPAASKEIKVIENSVGMKLVRIPAGEFMMGNDMPPAELKKIFPRYGKDRYGQDRLELADERPLHKVRITKPFYLGQCEVTIAQFRKFVDSGYEPESIADGTGGYGYDPKREVLPHEGEAFAGRDPKYSWLNPGFKQGEDHPVTNVTWNDAQAMCKWLSQKEGKKYRLPTEAEWEYACRAGTTTSFYSGNDPESLLKVANLYDADTLTNWPQWKEFSLKGHDGYAFTSPVGTFAPNTFGLYDMHGNVWEWCSDVHADDYYAKSPVNDPQGPETGRVRVRRGGSWHTWPLYVRSSYRNWNSVSTRYTLLGMRLVRED